MKRISNITESKLSKQYKGQAGYTFVEIAATLLIIGVLSALVAGGINIYLQQGQGRAAGEALARSMLKTKVRLQPDYTNVTLTGAISTGAFDNVKVFTVAITRDAVSHKMGTGGAITVAPANANTTAAFTIPGVPSFACEDLVQSIDVASDSIVVGAIVVKATGTPAANLNLIQCPLFGAGTTIVAQAK